MIIPFFLWKNPRITILFWVFEFGFSWCKGKVIMYKTNDKILDYHFLVHKGFVSMMFYVPRDGNQKVVTQNFMIALTGDKYFNRPIRSSVTLAIT